ncbi:protein O-mannosyl-transferase family [Hyunsoonleella sp. 2307UL5-6]|uniref:protein O-mannosyl-transferase family n=1 Tax=Hyunsoonleella sp. 2307UL5-6 TaxID=3384768 RepID=UPI0039BD65C6
MMDFNFKKWNTVLGWFSFLIALITYSLTVEPTVSFWDAGEYILTSSKLQVGHPPGAPLFQMLGAFFSTFTFGNNELIGWMMNMMSAVASAFTILFMFWTITLLLTKLVTHLNSEKDKETEINKSSLVSKSQYTAILGSGLVGSLAFAFTDSFWFNAVETEVYAMATLIMSALFWLALRWEQDMDEPRGNRWLILIAFIIGLSFGVHFMGLLTIPVIGLIYYFKNYKTITIQNFIIANIVSVAILLFVFKLLAPNILKVFSVFEIFFVNSVGLPFNSGSIIAGLLLVGVIFYALRYTRQKNYVHLNTGVLCLTFVIIGFSTWLMLPIRANANVVINENNPSSARELLAYYNLEQYPETHLFFGPQFTDMYAYLDENSPYIDDKPKYEKDETKGEYIIVNDWKNAKQNYNSEHASILPRMWSGEHAENYMMYTGFLNFNLKPEYKMQNELRKLVTDFRNQVAQGNVDYEDYNAFLKRYQGYLDIEKPDLASNIRYLFEYQLGYMYWRYFMWNFTGRQDDIQGRLDNNGNWISGITPIDEWHLGFSQDNLPSDVKHNKARNTYFFLPLLLGLIGLFFVLNTDKKRFWVMLVFFLFTGIAIQVYTNVRPFEPRERDYSVVGSFYVFALWIGIGVYAIYNTLKNKLPKAIAAPAISILCLILVPGILIANNWDDHDRSGKYTAQAMARKYLDSCAENAILFTIGDNDTFALWYAQEIEGYRTDVRVVNTSLFQTDWYIDQMKRKAYESDPIPSQLQHKDYQYGTNDYVRIEALTKDTISLKQALGFIQRDDEKSKYKYFMQKQGYDISNLRNQDLEASYLYTRSVRIPVNKENALNSGIVKPKDADKIVPYIDIEISGNAIYKNRLLMLDIVANNEWKRPIYFTGGSFGDDDYIWMKDYLQLDGMCYKLVPIRTEVDRANPFDMGRIDSDLMYEKVKKWNWGNSGSPDIYHDVETRKNSITYRGNLARLVETLINEDKLEKAEEIADIAMTNMPVEFFGYYTLLEPYISAYYEVDAKDKARDLYFDVSKKYQESLTYYSGLSQDNQERLFEDIYVDIQRYKGLIDVLEQYDIELAKKEGDTFNNYLRLFKYFYGNENEVDTERTDVDIPLDSDTTIKAND